jgi:hypothetical protein
MSDDLRELVGDDVPEPELDRLRSVDALLRATPAPPELPDTLTSAVRAIPGSSGGGSRRRLFAGLGIAAALAAGTFGIGIWVGGDSDRPPIFEEITLDATPQAPRDARMVIDVLPRDEAGNWPMAADASGLPPLPEGGYYEVWMTKAGRLMASCGRFVVDDRGKADDIWLNAPYPFTEYDRWVVVAMLPGQEPSDWLLDGPVVTPT